ncbi:TonB-dependent receptor [Povalibacter sp.]|uniref:TonB-dependent receptor n=1 Tax=Povalibacter sp. TaxID=1962978 RepID=UPI002F40B097
MSSRASSSALIFVMSGLASSTAVFAQSSAPGVTLEEIIVSARQREEKLSDVPATVQVFTANDIKFAGVERPGDFVALTPGLSQVQTAEVGDLQLNIRGINTGRDVETNFAFVIDGVLQTNPNSFNQELANVQQIEVLKGPQGAVFGRNALAGAVILTTREPTEDFEATATVGYGNKNTQKANAYLAGGLADSVNAGIGAFYRKTDGFYSNSFLGCDDCVDYMEEYGVTPRVMFEVGDNGKIDVKAKYSKLKSGAINFNAAFALPGFAAFTGNQDFFENVNEHPFAYINNISPQNEQENVQFSVKGDWDVSIGKLTAWAAYNDQTNYLLTDGASASFGLYSRTAVCQSDIAAQVGGPLPSPTFYAGADSVLPPYGPSRCDGYQYQQRDQEDVSAEIRIASPGDQAFRWLAGVYFADIERRVVVSQGSDAGLGIIAQGFTPTSGPSPTDLLYDDDFSSEVAAVFGQIAYDILPNLEVALALRFDTEKRSADNNVPTGANAFAQTVNFGPGPGVPYINPAYTADPQLATSGIPNRSRTFEQWQPKLSLNWKFHDGWSAFASYGYGFRSGGFNSTGSNATIAQFLGGLRYVDAAGNVTTQPAITTQGINYDDYNKEVSKAAEIGLKGEMLDRTVQVNLAAFHTTVEDMQLFNFLVGPFGLLRTVMNVDEVRLQGFEGDVRWAANDYISLFAGVGLIDSEIREFASRPYTTGNEVPYVPEYTANAGIALSVPLNTSLSLRARVDAGTVGKTWFGPVQDELVQTQFGLPGDYSKTRRDAYTLVNARIGFDTDEWSVTAWGRNLADKNYLGEVIPAPEFGGSFVHAAAGRAYGIDLTYNFGR